MQNKSALLLSLTAAAAAAALSGCVSTGPVDPERAAKHTPEYQYQKKLSRANNLATEFGVKHIMDRPASKDVKLTSDGSMLLDGAVWGALHGNVAGSGILSGTADWNIGFGLWLAQSLLLPSTDPTPDSLVGYVRAEEAQDRKAAVNAFVARAIPAIAESLKKQDQFKNYQISYQTLTGIPSPGILIYACRSPILVVYIDFWGVIQKNKSLSAFGTALA